MGVIHSDSAKSMSQNGVITQFVTNKTIVPNLFIYPGIIMHKSFVPLVKNKSGLQTLVESCSRYGPCGSNPWTRGKVVEMSVQFPGNQNWVEIQL